MKHPINKFTLSILFIFIQLIVYCQVDTLNQTDEKGLKQGYWIYYGKDRPDSLYPPEGKVAEGSYFDGKKNGIWIKYHTDGKTIRMRGEYANNRPVGVFVRGNLNNAFQDSVDVQELNIDNLKRGSGYYETNSQSPKHTKTAKDSIDLVLIVSVDKPYTAVGYGSVYRCRIDKIMKGSIQDTNISITILVGQEDKEKLFSAVLMKPKQLEIGFRKHGTNEEYSLIPIDGFVDKSKTSWEIMYMESLD